MITLAPIAENIQDTLNQKIRMLKSGNSWPPPHDDNSAPITDGEQGLEKNYMFARSPWLRMTSFLPRNYKKVESESSQENIGWNPVILMGGEENDYGRMRAGFEDRKSGMGIAPLNENDHETFYQYSGLYKSTGYIPLRPIPGVKDISVGYKGGGMKLGATRTGEINWTCWTWQELERLTPHFLSPGKTVLLEWGWTGVGALQKIELLDIFKNDANYKKSFNPGRIDDLNSKIAGHIQRQNGHYDAILGLIQNFSWSVNENGGFDCTTRLISPGVTLLQTKGKNDKWKNFDSLPLLKEQSPELLKEQSPEIGGITVADAKKSQLEELSNISPYITFREYMSDFASQIFHTFNYRSEGSDAISAEVLKTLKNKLYALYTHAALKESAGESVSSEITKEIDDLTAELSQYVKTSEGAELSSGGKDNLDFPSFRVDRFKLPSASGEIGAESVDGVSWENYMHKVSRVGAYHFITWGWFEDNVLSRFFGKIGDSGDVDQVAKLNKRVISEFRSIEQKVDPATGRLTSDVQSTRFKNSRYLVTLDSSKWIIPNIGDPFWGFVETSRPDVKLDGDNWKPTDKYQSGWVQDTFLPYNMGEDGEKVYDGVDHMDIRSILFNVEYLSKMSKKGNDMKSAVLSVWDDFARVHGNVYKFKIEFDDDTKRMMVREEGYTQIRVAELLKNKNEERKQSDNVTIYPNVYEFPIMEDGSIVKSQNINAKLPARMQVSAMYGSRGGSKSPDEEKQKKEQETYEDNVGKAWGKLSRAVPLTGYEDLQKLTKLQESNFNDLLTGDMDFPSRQNREFGRMDADISEKLTIGPLGKTDEVTGKIIEIPDGSLQPKLGTSIKPSILQDITDQQKIYIQEKKNIDFKKAKERRGTDLTISDIVKETQLFTAGFAAFDSRKKNEPNTVTSELFCYEPGQYEEWSVGSESTSEESTDTAGVKTTTVTPGEGYVGAVEGYTENLGYYGEDDWALESRYIQSLTGKMVDSEEDPGQVFETTFGLQTAFLTFKHTLRHSLIKLLRADKDGVLANVDPLLPIDFEMEIDGTGGMFPGNSFHSSYLGDSYKRQSVFQMVGVDHTIDSSGWFTTIKGQIRSTSEEQPEETKSPTQIAADMVDEAVRQAKAHAAATEFVKFQKKRLDEIMTERKRVLANAKLGNDRKTLIERYTGVNPSEQFPNRPVDKAAKDLFDALEGWVTGTPKNKVYNALKTTHGYTENQDALQESFAKVCSLNNWSNTDLRSWLDGDFDNSKYKCWYTEVAILAGYSHGSWNGKGWGDGNNAENGPPNCGPWIGNLQVSRSGMVKAPGQHAYPTGNYYIGY